MLLDAGADVNAVDKSGSSPLHISAVHDFTGCAELLIDRGAEVYNSL